MRMLSLLLVWMLGTSLFAADVDFSGTWAFNKDKSEMPEFGGGRGGGRFTPSDMVITRKKKKITVERTMTGRNGEERTTKTVYDLSGKTTKEKSRRGTTENVAKLDGEVLNIESVRIMERQGMEMEIHANSTWTLVDDGKGLLIHTVSETPMGKRESKMYYDKK